MCVCVCVCVCVRARARATYIFAYNTAQTPAVSFFAKYTPDLLAHALNASAALVVNTVVSNEGQAYDSHRGVFTAPFSGTYAFFLSDAASINHATVMQVGTEDELICWWLFSRCEDLGGRSAIHSSPACFFLSVLRHVTLCLKRIRTK